MDMGGWGWGGWTGLQRDGRKGDNTALKIEMDFTVQKRMKGTPRYEQTH